MKEQNGMKSYDELQFRDNFMFGMFMEDTVYERMGDNLGCKRKRRVPEID